MTAAPAPVLVRLTEASPKTTNDRVFLSLEHRPYICYGVTWVSGYILTKAPNGIGIPAGLTNVFVTLVEWGSLVPRFDRVPLTALDAAFTAKFGPVGTAFKPGRPFFPTVPFVIDLAASFIRQPPLSDLLPVVTLEFLLVPADAANLAAAGLEMPRTK